MPNYYRRCPRCNASLSALDKYCGVCGNHVSRPCPKCQHDVPIELPFCNYCGMALTPIFSGEKMAPQDSIKLLAKHEIKAFETRENGLKKQVDQLKRSIRNGRIIELSVIVVVLALVVFGVLPLVESQWNALYTKSPVRGMALVIFVAILIFLLIAYTLESRHQKTRETLNSLQARLALASERSEWAREELENLALQIKSNPFLQNASAPGTPAMPGTSSTPGAPPNNPPSG